MLISYTALFDANVLYPAPLRDLLMRIAMEDVFLARWTDRIHEEWIQNLLLKRADLTRAQLERTRNLMNKSIRDCLITDYEHLIEGLHLPDQEDRHVLAAAMKGRVDVIVTFNLADFPTTTLLPLGIEALHPDDFIVYQFDLNEAAVCRAVQKQRAGLRKPSQSADELLETLAKQSLPKTVARLRPYADLL